MFHNKSNACFRENGNVKNLSFQKYPSHTVQDKQNVALLFQ